MSVSGGAWFFVYRGFLGAGFVDPRVRSFIALMTRPPCLRAVLSCLKYLGGSNVISPVGLMRMIRVPWSTANPSSCCVLCGVMLVVMFVTCVTACGLVAYLFLMVSINSSGAVIMRIPCYQNMNTMTAPVPHEDIKNNHRRQQDGNPPTLRAPPFHIRAQATSGRS